MDFKKLIYKQNDADNTMRISKTKVITIIVFIIFFAWSFPDFLNNGLLSALFSAILVGLTLAIPTFVVGWIIGKLLNKTDGPKNNENYKNTNQVMNDGNNKNYAFDFKSLWIKHEFVQATYIYSKWADDYPNDLNCQYANIIINATMDSVSNGELLNKFRSLNQQQGSELTPWFKDMAERAIGYQAQEELKKSGYGGVQNVISSTGEYKR